VGETVMRLFFTFLSLIKLLHHFMREIKSLFLKSKTKLYICSKLKLIMSLTIELPTSIEQQFRQEATSKGLSLDNYLVQVLKQVAQLSQQKIAQKPLSEASLLKKINLGIADAEWATYKNLIALRNEERLTELEHKELIALGDKIENANALRLQYLFALAQLRNVPLPLLMADLGIKPIEV
jgi:hypothetical protein